MSRLGRHAVVPGHSLWVARPVRPRKHRHGGVRARHLLLLWQTITVDTADLRYGYEAISRYLAGGHPGFALIDSRRRRRAPGLRLRPDPAVSSTLRKR